MKVIIIFVLDYIIAHYIKGYILWYIDNDNISAINDLNNCHIVCDRRGY